MGYKALNEVKPLFKVYVWQGLFEVVVWIHIFFCTRKTVNMQFYFLGRKWKTL